MLGLTNLVFDRMVNNDAPITDKSLVTVKIESASIANSPVLSTVTPATVTLPCNPKKGEEKKLIRAISFILPMCSKSKRPQQQNKKAKRPNRTPTKRRLPQRSTDRQEDFTRKGIHDNSIQCSGNTIWGPIVRCKKVDLGDTARARAQRVLHRADRCNSDGQEASEEDRQKREGSHLERKSHSDYGPTLQTRGQRLVKALDGLQRSFRMVTTPARTLLCRAILGICSGYHFRIL